MFRSLSCVVTCSSYNNCQSVDEYVRRSKMYKDGIWGSDLELLCFAHLSKTCVFSYSKDFSKWDRYGPHNVDRTIPVDVSAKSVYLFHPTGHYDLVGCTVKVPNEAKSKKISRVALSLVTQNPSRGGARPGSFEPPFC